MTPHEALKSVKRDFTYDADSKEDRWIMPPLFGAFTGDCEEFGLAVLLRHAGTESAMFDMLANSSARIERVLSDRDIGHAVLWIKGAGYVDSIRPFFRDKRTFQHKQTFSEGDVRRKLDGKEVKAPADKKLMMLAGVLGAVALFLAIGGVQ